MKTCYKEMVRNRVPKVVDFALKWCKAKNRWIEHVYEHFINIYVDKDERKRATHAVLGLHKGKPINFDFHKSIFWDHFDATDDEVEYWEYVESWVDWFRSYFIYMNDVYMNSESEEECKNKLKTSFLKNTEESERDKLANFIIDCCKNYN